jgi:hypothetical protein
VDAGRRQSVLDGLVKPGEVADFAAANWWHPIHSAATEKLHRLDDNAWMNAQVDGRNGSFEDYISTFGSTARHLAEARTAIQKTARVERVQRDLLRMGIYRGAVDGGHDTTTLEAIARFRLRAGLPVSDAIDDALDVALDRAIERWTHPSPAELRAQRTGPPTEDQFLPLARRLGVELPALLAVYEIEAGGGGFLTKNSLREKHLSSTYGRQI